jgi:hypothetical protein
MQNSPEPIIGDISTPGIEGASRMAGEAVRGMITIAGPNIAEIGVQDGGSGTMDMIVVLSISSGVLVRNVAPPNENDRDIAVEFAKCLEDFASGGVVEHNGNVGVNIAPRLADLGVRREKVSARNCGHRVVFFARSVRIAMLQEAPIAEDLRNCRRYTC